MANSTAIFWIVAVILGILYYRFLAMAENPIKAGPKNSPVNILDAFKKLLLPKGKFIVGAVLIGIGQYNLSTLELPSSFYSQLVFTVPVKNDIFRDGSTGCEQGKDI